MNRRLKASIPLFSPICINCVELVEAFCPLVWAKNLKVTTLKNLIFVKHAKLRPEQFQNIENSLKYENHE